ncbi:hypothetical protein AHiyo1_04910 [Arthrobacter sp. Hiyo1]|nr:hypothetical protein AHiyo1_04910 [Arthrobacter sp. Hiyo1]
MPGGIDPDEPDPRAGGCVQFVQAVCRDGSGACEHGADVVGRVRHSGTDHDVACAQSQQERQPGHQFLGADGRQDVPRIDSRDPAAAGEPVGYGLAKSFRAVDRRVTMGVSCPGKRLADQLRRRIHGGSDGEIDCPARVF